MEKETKLRGLHAVMLMMLKDFSALCAREGMSWVAMFGTAIGALRHGGFIPWDDDVDICMPRADLERLVQVVQEGGMGEKYQVVNAQINPKYPLATTRLMLKGTEFRDSALATMDFDSGIFLDLFPLDDVPDDERLFRRQAWRAWLFNKLAIAQLNDTPHIVAQGVRAKVLRVGVGVARFLLRLPGVRSVDFAALSYREATRYAGDETSRRVAFMCDTSRFDCLCDRSDLFPVRMVAFEDMQVPLACRAEKLLDELYGNWRELPPEEGRYAHYPDVLDFGPYAGVAEEGMAAHAS